MTKKMEKAGSIRTSIMETSGQIPHDFKTKRQEWLPLVNGTQKWGASVFLLEV